MIDYHHIRFSRPPKVTELAVDLVKLAVLAIFTLPAALGAAGRRARRRLLAWAVADPGYAVPSHPDSSDEKERSAKWARPMRTSQESQGLGPGRDGAERCLPGKP